MTGRPSPFGRSADLLDKRVDVLGIDEPAQVKELPGAPQVSFVHGFFLPVQLEDEQPLGAVVKHPGRLGTLFREPQPVRSCPIRLAERSAAFYANSSCCQPFPYA